MKIIDLLVKIANGEDVPKKIKYEDTIYYFNTEEKRYLKENLMSWIGLCDDYLLDVILNDEVEIIEEDNEIEYLHFHDLKELIDKLEKILF